MNREFYYDTQGNSTLLVYKVGAGEIIDSVSLGMLTNNRIPGIATTMFTQMDETMFIKYNVSSKLSVSQAFSGSVSKKRLLGVFSGIVDAIQSADDYMLDPSSIVLDLDYIFTDVSTAETMLICCPISDKSPESVDLRAFLKNIMLSIRLDDADNGEYFVKILNYLNSTLSFSTDDFSNLLKQLKKETVSGASVQPKPRSTPAPQRIPTTAAPASEAIPELRQPMPSKPGVVQTNSVSDMVLDSVNEIRSIPVSQSTYDTPAAGSAAESEGEKPMSMFYLLQHYNKENSELYKAQKKAKKDQKASPAPVEKSAPAANQKKEKGSQKADPRPVAYAIPGVSAAEPEPVIPEPPKQQPPVSKPVISATPEIRPVQPIVKRSSSAGADFGGTVCLDDDSAADGTVVIDVTLTQKAGPSAYLIRSKTNEKIKINKAVFHIGKEKSYADYCIFDNPTISRSHASIFCHDGEYFLVDTNSKNHSFINSMMVKSNLETKLTSGDKVRLANEQFEFIII